MAVYVYWAVANVEEFPPQAFNSWVPEPMWTVPEDSP